MKSTSPTYSTFKNAVNNGQSTTLTFEINVNNKGVAHCVSVVGYRSARDSSNKLYEYVYIADGWYTTLRYICITTAGFVHRQSDIYIFK